MYHANLTGTLTPGEIANTFLYGLRMDLSFAGYICIFPFLLFLAKTVVPKFKIRKLIWIYSTILIVLISFLVVADLELYNVWGFRMDITPLKYFKTPKEMAATISTAPVFFLLLIFLVLAGFSLFLYKKYVDRNIEPEQKKFRILDTVIAVLLIGLLILPIRGGIQKIPMAISDVYFSHKLYADHAAINLPWNVMFSFINRREDKNPFHYFDEEKAEQLVVDLYSPKPIMNTAILGETPNDSTDANESTAILNVKKPNIVLVILESFTAKWVGSLGGAAGVTPNLDRIAQNGLSFTNIYAAGDRSEKGQVAILSGYPNQAIASIIKTPTKTRSLPAINTVLGKAGYQSSFTYGGELEFANIKSYLITIGIDKLTDKYDFPISERTTSWGVHDQYVFDRFYHNIKDEKEPFFAVLYTLSSHEPYDVPMKPHFKGNDETTLFKNSIYYTDSIIGAFIQEFKKNSLWTNTLVVFVADHGHHLPGNDPVYAPSKFHIPLIFSGGALNARGKINTIGSQTDIATTLLNLLDLPTTDFKWGKDLLDSSAKSFAFYSFNNGFGFVTPNGAVTIDNVSKKIIHRDKGVDTAAIQFGKAYMQVSYQDFLER